MLIAPFLFSYHPLARRAWNRSSATGGSRRDAGPERRRGTGQRAPGTGHSPPPGSPVRPHRPWTPRALPFKRTPRRAPAAATRGEPEATVHCTRAAWVPRHLAPVSDPLSLAATETEASHTSHAVLLFSYSNPAGANLNRLDPQSPSSSLSSAGGCPTSTSHKRVSA